MTTANQVNLKLEECQQPMFTKTAYAMAGFFKPEPVPGNRLNDFPLVPIKPRISGFIYAAESFTAIGHSAKDSALACRRREAYAPPWPPPTLKSPNLIRCHLSGENPSYPPAQIGERYVL